ncbi:alpha/beta fold hydrolase [Amycolatopsis sp. cg5]|uniref:alpha/beta fold hydrolase n=1 Tax=Amycolatopsis sp. cg5 TaxID=3238802 RepID=UPI003524D027
MARGFQGAVLRGLGARDHEATVVGTELITPQFVRIQFTSPTLFADATAEPTAWLRFWFPDPDGGDTEYQRAYTITEADPASGAFSVDVVLHSPAGPASQWARSAKPGMKISVMTLGSSKFEPTSVAGYLLIGDPASLPAINTILDVVPADVPVELYLERHSEADELIPVHTHPLLNTKWVPRDGAGSLAAAIEPRDWTGWVAWAATETKTLKQVRARLRDTFGFAKQDIQGRAYWHHGRATGTLRSVQHTQGTSEWVDTPDGRRLHAMVLPGPEAGPTVVFEAGAAASRSSWALVQPGVARAARAIVYDRSGLGRSAPDPGGRTLRRMADDLVTLLDHFGPGPFVLVGHSAGGPIVRLAAAARPDQVAGLVLVDPTDEAAEVLFGRRFRRGERLAIGAGAVLARLGLFKFLLRGMLRGLPADVRRDMEQEAFTPGVVRTQREQARTFLDELSTWRENPPAIKDIPVTVVSGALTGGGMTASMRAQATASHAHRAAQSPQGNHAIAPRSGHYVPVTDPDLLCDEIIGLIKQTYSQ